MAQSDVLIYGKGGCPHTRRALEAMPGARFVDVLADPAGLDEMLRLTGGVRRVPVIVRPAEKNDAEGAEGLGKVVEIGYRRGA